MVIEGEKRERFGLWSVDILSHTEQAEWQKK